jgi:hypothetical protein
MDFDSYFEDEEEEEESEEETNVEQEKIIDVEGKTE